MKAHVGNPPGPHEFELTLIGPGYGESVVVHLGHGFWMIVDSCVDSEGEPRPLSYLEGLGVEPSEAVGLVVASHWHDDHIGGLAEIVARCSRAAFCCSGALRSREFLAAVGSLETRSHSRVGSGVREMHTVLCRLDDTRRPVWSLANRRLHRQGVAEVWALSPADAMFEKFLRSLEELLPGLGETKRRLSEPSPNEVSVVLWARSAEAVVLLGADLERSGWTRILASETRPEELASAFKLPHHGSENAHEPAVWEQMVGPEPVAVLAPWRRGDRALPTEGDVRRILRYTSRAYATAPPRRANSRRRRGSAVDRTVKEIGVDLCLEPSSGGAVRLRRPLDGGPPWSVETLGSAIRLSPF